MELFIKEILPAAPAEVYVKEIKKIREVKKFNNSQGLIKQMKEDLKELA